MSCWTFKVGFSLLLAFGRLKLNQAIPSHEAILILKHAWWDPRGSYVGATRIARHGFEQAVSSYFIIAGETLEQSHVPNFPIIFLVSPAIS